MLAISFHPLFEAGVTDHGDGSALARSYRSFWNPAGSLAVFGLLLLIAFVGLLSIAAMRVETAPLLASIAAIAALLLLILVSKPHTGDPEPDLSWSGLASGVLLALTAVVTTVHAVQVRQRG